MHPDKTSTGIIIVGSVLFLIAAFSPISRIFGIRDTAERLEIITAAPIQWIAAQVLFALGSLVTAVGIGMLAYRMSGQSFAIYLYSTTVLTGIGALLWSWHVYMRAVDPALFTSGGIPFWLFGGYSLMTILGLALMGIALLQAPIQPWVGSLALGTAVLFLLLGLLFRDMPPLVYYVVTLTVGVALYRMASAALPAAG